MFAPLLLKKDKYCSLLYDRSIYALNVILSVHICPQCFFFLRKVTFLLCRQCYKSDSLCSSFINPIHFSQNDMSTHHLNPFSPTTTQSHQHFHHMYHHRQHKPSTHQHIPPFLIIRSLKHKYYI